MKRKIIIVLLILLLGISVGVSRALIIQHREIMRLEGRLQIEQQEIEKLKDELFWSNQKLKLITKNKQIKKILDAGG